MELKVEVEKVDDVRRRLAVEVPADAVTAELDRAFAELARSVAVPGFRRGRVPRPVLERMFGDRVRSQVFERMMHDSFVEAVEGRDLAIVGRPDFETEAVGVGQGLRYQATFEVRPDVTVASYVGLEAERPEHIVDDSEVDSVLERMRESNARLHPITDRNEVGASDVVTISYQAKLDGKIIGKAEGREVEIGRNGFPPEFDAHLVGAAVGDTVRFAASYPEQHPIGDLAGKTVDFEVQVASLASKELPALDDDFAKANGDSDTLDQLRERVREGLQNESARRSDEMVRRQLLAKLVELNEVQLPNALVARRLDALVDEAWEDWRQQRIQPRNEGAAKDQLRTELEGRARDQVKLSLLLDAIAMQEGLSVSDADVDERIAQIAEQAGGAAERVQAFYNEASARAQLRASLLQGRAIDVVVRGARISARAPESKIADASENG